MSEKSEVLRFRCTPMEREVITNAAKAAGMTISAYLIYKAAYQTGYDLADKIISKSAKKK